MENLSPSVVEPEIGYDSVFTIAPPEKKEVKKGDVKMETKGQEWETAVGGASGRLGGSEARGGGREGDRERKRERPLKEDQRRKELVREVERRSRLVNG